MKFTTDRVGLILFHVSKKHVEVGSWMYVFLAIACMALFQSCFSHLCCIGELIFTVFNTRELLKSRAKRGLICCAEILKSIFLFRYILLKWAWLSNFKKKVYLKGSQKREGEAEDESKHAAICSCLPVGAPTWGPGTAARASEDACAHEADRGLDVRLPARDAYPQWPSNHSIKTVLIF